jgi:hypothetical protein
MSRIDPTLRAAAVLLAAALAARDDLRGAEAVSLRAGESALVTGSASKNPHYELLAAADPVDAKRMLACSMVLNPENGGFAIGAYLTTDGGKTWRRTLQVEQGRLTGDPACAFGPDRMAYVAALGGDTTISGQDDSYTFVYRSEDGGESWKEPIRLGHTDREFLVVDTTDNKYRGRVYLNATGIVKAIDDETVYGENMAVGVAFFHSQDRGASFDSPVRVLSSGGKYVLGMGNSVVLSDGLYVAVFGEQIDRKNILELYSTKANAALKAVTSEDGGDHFSKSVTVSDWYMDYRDINGSASVVPTIAVDASDGPFRDRLYAVWPDYRSGRGEILLSTSSDRAKTWSKPIVVNDDQPFARRGGKKGPDNSLPVVAVNPAGVAAVSWYDRREDPKNLAWTQRIAVSFDGGETFGPSVRIPESSYDPARLDAPILFESFVLGGAKRSEFEKGDRIELRASGDFYFNGGHTSGLVADAAGDFHPFWIDNRTGVAQIRTASVLASGRVVRNGDDRLANLEDLSKTLTLSVAHLELERARNVVSFDAAVENTSDTPVSGPIYLRMLSAQSMLGSPELAGSDASGARRPTGAIFDFTPLLKSGGLKPGERSASRHLEFRLVGTDALEPEPPAWQPKGWFGFEARLYGPAPPKK